MLKVCELEGMAAALDHVKEALWRRRGLNSRFLVARAVVKAKMGTQPSTRRE